MKFYILCFVRDLWPTSTRYALSFPFALDFKVGAVRCGWAHYAPGRSLFLPNLLRPEIHLHFTN